MATLIAAADGNFTTAATWGVASSVAENDSEAASTNITNANTDSSTFVLAATAVTGVAVKISSVITPTGTLTVTLRNSTSGTNVGSVTINVSDLPLNARGWLLVSFASHTPNGTDSYLVRTIRSVADGASNRITLYTLATTNLSRQVRTTTTGAPASGDKLIVAGEYTAASTLTPRTVTVDNTATTSFGAVAFPQSLSVNAGGILQSGSSASTAYFLKIKGLVDVYAGGILALGTPAAAQTIVGCSSATPVSINITGHGYTTGDIVYIYGVLNSNGTVLPIANGVWKVTRADADNFTLDGSVGQGTYVANTGRVVKLTPLDSTSTFTFFMDPTTNVDSGINVRSGGGFITSGATKTAWTRLTEQTDINNDANSLGCHVTTSTTTVTWKEGQKFSAAWTGLVAIGPYATTATTYTITGIPSTTSLTTTATTGTLTAGAVLSKIGSDATSVLQIANTIGWVANDMIVLTPSSVRNTSTTSHIINTVDSSTQVTIKGTFGSTLVSVTNGSAAVTWVAGPRFVTGTNWNSTGIAINGNSYTVSSVTSDTALTLTGNYSQATDGYAVLYMATTAKNVNNCCYSSALNNTSILEDVRCEVANLTRNIKIIGSTVALQGFVNNEAASRHISFYTEYYYLGSATTNKRGVDVATTATGVYYSEYSSYHDFIVASSRGINVSSASGSNITINNNVFHNIIEASFINVVTTGVQTIINNLVAGQLFVGSACGFNFGDVGGIITGNIVSGQQATAAAAFFVNESAGTVNTFNNNISHSNGAVNPTVSQMYFSGFSGYSYLSDCKVWRGANVGIQIPYTATGTNILDNITAFGCVNGQIVTSGYNTSCFYFTAGSIIYGQGVLFRNCNIHNGSAWASAAGLFYPQNANIELCMEDSNLGVATASTMNQVARGIFSNCNWGATSIPYTYFAGQTSSRSLTSIRHNQTNNDHRRWTNFGLMQTDFVINRSSSGGANISLRGTPNSASYKLLVGPFLVALLSGTTTTVSVWVRKSVVGDTGGVAYAGSQPRLVMLKNGGTGIGETVLATMTAAAGNWEQLTATIGPVTSDTVARLFVDCDMSGAGSWINAADFEAIGPQTGGMNFWTPGFDGIVVTSKSQIGPKIFRQSRIY